MNKSLFFTIPVSMIFGIILTLLISAFGGATFVLSAPGVYVMFILGAVVGVLGGVLCSSLDPFRAIADFVTIGALWGMMGYAIACLILIL